jgi:hypothetical protein
MRQARKPRALRARPARARTLRFEKAVGSDLPAPPSVRIFGGTKDVREWQCCVACRDLLQATEVRFVVGDRHYHTHCFTGAA